MNPDSYTYTILLSVCANLLPRHDTVSRYRHASAFFDRCREAGYVNDYVLRKLRQTVDEQEYLGMVSITPIRRQLPCPSPGLAMPSWILVTIGDGRAIGIAAVAILRFKREEPTYKRRFIYNKQKYLSTTAMEISIT